MARATLCAPAGETVTLVVPVVVAPRLSVTTTWKTRVVLALTAGAVKFALAAVALVNVTAAPAVWVQA